jgi:1-acyl-sn-glycerol-3-phosphate acyltransferase
MFYRFARAVICSAFKVLFRVRVSGKKHVPRGGVYIVAPTHRSVLDIPFAAFVTRRRIRFMAKKELFSSKFGRWLFRMLAAIPVDRGGADRAALRAAQAALEDGEPIGVFPEGTRRSGPEIVDLLDGVSYLALKAGVPILPVGIGGSEQIMERGRVLPRIRKVALVIGPVIVPPAGGGGSRPRSEISALTQELRVALQTCFDAAQKAVSR